jgi:hypothetical protein
MRGRVDSTSTALSCFAMRCAGYLAALAADQDVEAYAEKPLTEDEKALAEIAEWGPADDWADWADAAR